MIKQLLGIIFLGVVSLYSLYFFFENPAANSAMIQVLRTYIPKKNVVIFAGTTYFGNDYTKGNRELSKLCPMEDYCRLTSNASELHLADAVVYHNREFNGTMFKNSSLQIMFTAESPIHESIRFKPGAINWTMTYRLDSDIYTPYGYFFKSDTVNNVDFESLWLGKDGKLTSSWMVSNCDTGNKRMELIRKAQREGLPVDIFGSCGKAMPRCGRYSKDQYECAEKVLSKYKFYFAFENSNCLDYTTEKFWNALSFYKAVPIVIERQNIENLGVPGSAFVALDDFPSIKAMVEFLNELKENKERYLGYHKWRRDYSVETASAGFKGFCALCRRLSSPTWKPKVYQNLADWFSKTTCNNSYAFHYL